MNPTMLPVIFLLWCVAATAHAQCVWPDYVMIPAPETGDRMAEGDAETSWQTEGQIKETKQQVLNGLTTTRTWVRPVANDTILLHIETRKVGNDTMEDEEHANVTTLTCQQGFGKDKFLVKVDHKQWYEGKDVSPESKRQCVQFIKRSPFVLQWARGPEARDIVDCPDFFAAISSWPLVFYPVRRNTGPNDAERYPRLHQQYQPCPRLGGFQMRVHDRNGVPIKSGCKNNFPSPRLELECYHGDGMRILQNQKKCKSYVNHRQSGAKLNCLGSWDDDEYTFSVMLPNDAVSVNSFHCLRINHKNPTAERAILFLDTQCYNGHEGNVGGAFFQMDLRKKRSPGVCDDLSDHCSARRCNVIPYSCVKTCAKCPLERSDPVEFDEEIQGSWILPSDGLQKTVEIKKRQIAVLGFGHFRARGPIDENSCLGAPEGWDEDVFEQVLSGPGNGLGCGPRISQMRAKKISESVLLLQMPPPAPLREDQAIATTSHWCYNNYRDAHAFRSLFRPYTSYTTIPPKDEDAPNPNGYFTLIAETNQTAADVCIDFDQNSDLNYAANQKVNFVVIDSTGENHTCEGEAKMDGNEWSLDVECPNGDTISSTFTCLGDYKVTEGYHAVVLKGSGEFNENATISLKEEYYCLLLPVGDPKQTPLLLNQAAHCDPSFLYFAERKLRVPSAVLYDSGSTRQGFSLTAVIFLALTLLVNSLC